MIFFRRLVQQTKLLICRLRYSEKLPFGWSTLVIFLTLISSCSEGIFIAGVSEIAERVSSSTQQNSNQNSVKRKDSKQGRGETSDEESDQDGEDDFIEKVPMADCSNDLSKLCLGGYDDDRGRTPNRTLPVKYKFIGNVGIDIESYSKNSVAELNKKLQFDQHQFIKLELIAAERHGAVPGSVLSSISQLASRYGEEGYFVVIIAVGFSSATGLAGGAPGAFLDINRKESFVIMDYGEIQSQGDKYTLAHEMLHTFGAPHSTDTNVFQDNYYKDREGRTLNGLFKYSRLQLGYQSSNELYDCFVRKSGYDSMIFMEDEYKENKLVEVEDDYGNLLEFNTSTIMYPIKISNADLFNKGNSFNQVYSRLLSTYYEVSVGDYDPDDC